MSDDTLLPFELPSVRRKKLTVDFAGGNQSSAGGLLLLREVERKLGVCRRLAEAMPDRRDPDRVRHAMFEMVMARASAIACGYEDAIDLDRLRHDPLMKVAVGRCPETGAPLASQRPSLVFAATATIPQLGFIHEDSGQSFVLDIADLVRDTVTIPCAFRAAAIAERRPAESIERVTRRLTGERLRRDDVIPLLIERIKTLLADPSTEEEKATPARKPPRHDARSDEMEGG